MEKRFLIHLLAPSLILTLSACSSGGGSGSSPSTAVPQYVKTPKATCGGKDCFSGSVVSSRSVGTLSSVEGDSAYSSVKHNYSEIKALFTDLGKVGYAVQLLNAAANENDVTSCDDIPTSGTFSFVGYDFTLEPSAESWSFSGSAATMTHKVTAVDSYMKHQYNFNCDSTVQRLHIISEQSDISYKVEIYSEVNLSTGEIHIQAGEISSSNKTLLYFSSDGGGKFTLAKLGTDGSVSGALMATSDVENPPEINPELQYVEVVTSGSSVDDLDGADWGFGLDSLAAANTYRGCIANYRSPSPTAYDNSCNASDPAPANWTTRYANLSNLPALLVGDGIAVTSWSISGLANLVIPNP